MMGVPWRPPVLSGLSILVVEDEPLLRRHIASSLERLGADVSGADSIRGARQMAQDLSFDFVLIDVNLPDGRGIDLLREGVLGSNTETVVMTGDSSVAGAVEAMKLGALDYLTKPFEPKALALVMTRARQHKQAARITEHRRRDSPETSFFFDGSLAALETQLQRILVADQRLHSHGAHLPPVVIQGKTGTGKTTVARWIHGQGPRSGGALVEANCAAIPDGLAESELFGHERGAFTDARSARMGLFEAANGWTLFPDELASLSLPLQAKLLTALEDHKVRRLGGNRDIPVDIRVIAAANRDLKELVGEGRFREDLYHRLDLYRIHLPPLRNRGDDVLHLADALLARLSRRHRLPTRSLSETGRRRVLAYGWPGNVRELAHELERALVFEDGEALNLVQLMGASPSGPAETRPLNLPVPVSGTVPGDWFNPLFRFPNQGFSLEEAILRLIHHALAQTHGNVSAAARLLGVSRDYLRYRLGGWKDGSRSASGPSMDPDVSEPRTDQIPLRL